MPATKSEMKRPVEFAASIPSKKVLDDIETKYFDAFYLGQPYCLKIKGNFLTAIDDMKSAVNELHAKGKKAYLVTPAIPKASELPLIRKAIDAARQAGIDAVEAHDVGIFRLLRKDFSDLRVHVGNFANVYNERSAAVFKRLGAARIVPSHELTGPELAIVAGVEGVEFERPVHGLLSLGMAFSCQLVNGNKGVCHQECSEDFYLELDGWRMRSVGTSLLTGEDYCLIEHLDELLEIGLTSWRFETYFESSLKINLLGKIYNKALDDIAAGKKVGNETVIAARELASKGLCNGWYFGKSGRDYVGAGETCVE